MTHNSQPLISIGMSVRNNAPTVGRAIQSILDQTYRNWELLLYEDGSDDATREVAAGFADERIRLFADGLALGLPRRLNQALDESRGEIFARMDGDDVSYPERLEKQLEFLRACNLDLVGACAIVFGQDGRPIGKRKVPVEHALICAHPWSGFPMMHPTFLGKMEFFKRYRYDPTAFLCQDQEFLSRAYLESKLGNVPEVLLGYFEGKLDLRKLLISRGCLAKRFAQGFIGRKEYVNAARAINGQLVRAAVDTVAVGTGLDHRLLRQRAAPASPAELERWRKVWEEVNRGTGSSG